MSFHQGPPHGTHQLTPALLVHALVFARSNPMSRCSRLTIIEQALLEILL